MKDYYYADNGQKVGPVSKEELKGKITKETLIWKEGMENWLKASEIAEFNDFFQKEPPPIPDAKATTENEPPPIPEVKSKSNKHVEKIIRNAIFLVVLSIIMGFLEYKEYDKKYIYNFIITGIIIGTYYLIRGIKGYLNKVLSYNDANVDLNILTVTSVILGFAIRATPILEKRMESEEANFSLIIIILVFIVALILNIIYFFILGKKLSKIKNKIAGKISMFAYSTLAIFVLSFVFTMTETKLIFLDSILFIIPMLFLVIDFNENEKII
jgi:cation transport ATPase